MTGLICPVCKKKGLETPLERENNSLLCANRHCFDIA